MNQGIASRKRAAPSAPSRRRVWALVSSVTMALSVSSAVAFQSSLPQTHGRGRCGTTAPHVVTDPNNFIQIEKRKSVADRAALEELYMLSLAAEAQMASNHHPNRKTKIKRKKTSTKKATTSATRLQKKRPLSSSSILHALKSEVEEFGGGSPSSSNRPSSADADIDEEPHFTQKHTHPQFKGLTTQPNRRNLHKKSLSTVSPVVRNPTLRQGLGDYVLQELELELKQQQISAPIVQETASVLTESTSTPDQQQQKSRSSTMPGFKERAETLRQQKYRDGLKLMEQRSGKMIEVSEEERTKRRAANGENMYKTSDSVPDSLVHFAKELHQIERITPSEEVELGEKTQEAIKLQKIYDRLVNKLDREPTDDEWCAAAGKINMEAIAQAIDDGFQAKNRLVTSNLRMVQGVVNLYIKNGLQGQYNSGDLMQEGILALIRAAEKFDPNRGFRFSTYAMYWIRSAIKRDQLSQSRVIQVPSRMFEKHKQLMKIEKEFLDAYGRRPTMDELSEATGLTPLQIERCEEAMAQRTYSLDQNLFNAFKPMNSEPDKETLYEIVEKKAEEFDPNRLEYQMLREDLIKALYRHLSKEEANLLMLRYGLIENKDSTKRSGLRTIAEVSKLAGLKPDKVRRLLNRSLTQLQTVIGDEWRDYERELESGFE